MNLQFEWRGLSNYRDGLKAQSELVSSAECNSHVLGYEFQPVVTLGKRGSQADLYESIDALSDKGIEVVQTDRGGHATLHSPGQLVIYPVFSLRKLKWSVKDYICWLQKTTKAFLRHYGVVASERSAPGLYTENGKIAFFGVRVVRGVTQHGVSINVSNELGLFSCIKSCDIEGETFDRMNNYLDEFKMDELFKQWISIASKEKP